MTAKFQGEKKEKKSNDFGNLLSHPLYFVTFEANEWRGVCELAAGEYIKL